ncbi:carbohydrate ABC transporter substrate-binding protein, CUT1 family [Tistlia consotensis]|uniref:sn-glycerol-3-phosphate-binding periplasmic protein UgpB n=1 Tax=Tistlia consotensis USBA 355 TaxID=560819 RepID=A0A1Y6B469_9PROT|nr:sn-glycerol-3-phosphate ABC transporter substrate-binding protein UgpB [Tistlia consotensis]SME88509.1 carbohydrate ABC transporter substrate-binding protein, CUT1 family [Tistlia consotensis USBA 355]SNR24975.1 carbohydrate ABC transporter substrate-binding protein, CUT1 family [Tistlia consotensis]
MSLRILGMLAAGTLAALASSAAQAATEVDFWHAFSPDIKLGKVLTRYVEEFNASQDDYKVVLTYKGTYDDTVNATIAAYRAGKQPAIVQVQANAAPTLIFSSAIKPVDDVMAEAGIEVDWSRYLEPVMAMYRYKGKQMAMPFNTSTPLMWYNADAFQKAGIDKIPATWTELEAAARRLKAAGYPCPVTSAWQEWVLLKNYAFVQDLPLATEGNGMDGPDARLVFNHNGVVEQLARIGRWSKEGLFEYQGRQWTGAHQAFYAERCAVLLESSAGYGGISQNAKFKFGAAVLPVEEGTKTPRNTFIGGAGLFVMKGLDKAVYDGAAAFFKFLSAPELQFDWHRNSGYVPITVDAYELARKQGYYEKFPHQELAIKELLRQPSENTRGIRLGYLVQIDEILNEEMEKIWSQEKSAQQAADDMVRRADPLLARFAKTVAD